MKLIIVLLPLILFTKLTFAWGGRGHHVICSAAVFLVQNKDLKDFLKSRPHMMGHLCNIPDFHWKNLGGDAVKYGSPTHYIDTEIIGKKVSEVSTDLNYLIKEYTGKQNQFDKEKNIIFFPNEFGTVWWRVDQFMRRVSNMKESFKNTTPPTNSKEEQNENLEYNKLTYDFIVNIGLMGHFVGDASQPFHSTVDYDGYAAGHGGIHAYYEDAAVSSIGPELELKIYEEGKKLLSEKTKFLTAATTLDKMKALSEISLNEVKSVLQLDPVTQRSSVKKEKGMELKTPAERKPISEVFKKFEPLVIKQMGRSAALLASLWDEAYKNAGTPKLTAYKSYKFPFTPDFIEPDYFEKKFEKK